MSTPRPFALPALLLACAALTAHAQPTIANAVSSAPAAGAALQGPALLNALRSGGYVVYFRHTATDFSRGDSAMTPTPTATTSACSRPRARATPPPSGNASARCSCQWVKPWPARTAAPWTTRA